MKFDRTRRSTRVALSTARWIVIALVGLVSILVLAGLVYPLDHVRERHVMGPSAAGPRGSTTESGHVEQGSVYRASH